jgi:hypothetical protein
VTRVIIISGASGSGKSTLAQRLSLRLGARVLNVGDLIFGALLAHDFKPQSRPHAGKIFLEYFGELALGPLLLSYLRHSETVIIDGLRLPYAKELLSRRMRQTFHVHVDVAQEIRWHRLLERDGLIHDVAPVETYLPALRSRADLVISHDWPSRRDHTIQPPLCRPRILKTVFPHRPSDLSVTALQPGINSRMASENRFPFNR